MAASPSKIALAPRPAADFFRALARRPVRGFFGFFVEYAMFASGVFLALALYATRVPMRLLDRAFGTQMRDRFVDFIARLSPG